MVRPLRLQVAGGVLHVTARGNRRQAIFRSDDDRTRFLALLQIVCARFQWRCHGYCLMTNHYHLLIETPHEDLSKALHWLNFRYAQWFNKQHKYSGHLFQGRFHSVLVESNVRRTTSKSGAPSFTSTGCAPSSAASETGHGSGTGSSSRTARSSDGRRNARRTS